MDVIEQVASRLTSDMPDNTRSDMQNDMQSNAYDGPVDSYGRPFDPRIHSIGIDGKPRINARSGKLRVRRGMGNSAPRGSYVPAPSNPDAFDTSGKAVSASFILACQMLGGDDWTPNADERGALEHAWIDYFRARGIADVPPELMLGIALTAYAGPRIMQSDSWRNRLRRWYGRITGQNGAQSHNRNDGERENDARGATS